MNLYVGFKNEIWEILEFKGRIFSANRSTKIWKCRCFCGREVFRKSQDISSGRAKSCGCYIQSRPGNKLKHESNTSHGFARKNKKHPLYINWMGMKQRCYNPKHISYKYYGEKGISIFDEWNNDFSVFMKWCLINNWKDGLTIDRIDTAQGYFPENCRIITKSENSKRSRC